MVNEIVSSLEKYRLEIALTLKGLTSLQQPPALHHASQSKPAPSVVSLAQGSSVAGPRAPPPTSLRPGGRGPLPARSNPWGNSKRTSIIKTAMSNASRARAHPAPLVRVSEEPDQLAAQLSQMNVNGPADRTGQGQVWNPSEGPSRSTVTNWRANTNAPSQAPSRRTARRAVHNAVCKLSGLTKRDFRIGDVISLPYHTPNCNPNVAPNDERLRMTVEGPVYSKCRMFIVLWIYEEEMFCVPLYSFNCKGLKSKPNNVQQFYVSAMNEGDVSFVNQGMYPPVEINMRKRRLHEDTTVHITGGTKVGCQEDISRIGRMTKATYNRLVGLWHSLNEQAKKQSTWE